MKRMLVLLLGALVAAGLTSCGGKPGTGEKPAAAGKKITIAVIPKGTTHEFWKSVHAGAVKAAAECGCEIVWKGPLKEDDREAQISVVEDFIARGVSGMVLAPLDDSALKRPVSDAMKRKIPVVIFDSGLQGEDYVSFVATDNRKGGRIGGEFMGRLLHGTGRVAMLRYQEGSASTMEREQGFLDAIKESPGIELVSANQYGGPTVESACKAAENLLAPLRKADGSLNVDGIFCPNESTTMGMLKALQDAGVAGKVRFVGFDSSPKLVEALDSRQIHGLVLQNPMKMGEMGVKTMFDHLSGKQVERRLDTGVSLATGKNMKSPEIQSLLAPDFKKWLNE